MFQNEYDKNEFSFIFAKEEDGENLIDEIKEFTSGKKAFFFSASDFGKQSNLNRLYKEMQMFFEERTINKENKSLSDICEYMSLKSSKNRLIWIFNNVDELIEDKDFTETEKLLKNLKQTDNMVIFVSQSAVFSNKFEESKLTKYVSNKGLSTPVSFYNLEEEQISAEDKFKYYAIFGTKKEYRKKIDFNKDLKTNIVNNFFTANGFFYTEPNRILKKELRETQIYNVILEAVSKGASTLNDISEFVEMPTSICNKYLTVLISLGIINKVKPAFGKETRKSRYKIADNAMDFWYYFVPENMSDISLNNGDKVFDSKINCELNKYLKMKFPELCKEYINKLKKENKINFDIKENSIWWNKDEIIDIVAGSGLEAITADCYWTDEVIGKDALISLENKAKEVDVIDREYYLFSKRGFDKELSDIAKTRNDVKLFSLNDMIAGNAMVERPRKMSFFFSRK